LGGEPLGAERLVSDPDRTGVSTMDFVYIALGLALFGVFGLYAVLLRRV